MSKMTLEEKIGQLNLPTSGDITTGAANSSNVAKNIAEGKVGGLFNIKSVQKIKEVQKIAVEKSRLKIPLLFGMDVIHGYETTFPIPLGLSCTWDMKMIERSDYNTVDMSRIKMYNDYFPPYKAAIDAGVGSVMASFNEIDGIPATGNKWLMTVGLGKQWGFKGVL